jgi:hypothetical protein
MKASLVIAALALSITAAVSAQAQTADAPPVSGDFTAHKAKLLAHLDQRITAITATRNCVANAATAADLKSCRSQNRGAMKPGRAPT